MNGNISGKEYKITDTKKTNTIAPNDAKVEEIFKSVDGEELKKLGEGKFEIKISRDNGNNITVEIKDKSHFNGGKEYVMDSVTLDNFKENETFNIAGITLELIGLKDANIATSKSGSFEFTNSVSKEEEGIRLQVGANREQMVGLSVGNMRNRELGLDKLC